MLIYEEKKMKNSHSPERFLYFVFPIYVYAMILYK